MALSIADYIAWDFLRASNPLNSIAGQAETFALSGGATVDTTNGIRLPTTGDLARLTCTNGGDLVGWAYPYTFVFIGKRRTTGTGFGQPLLYRPAPVQLGITIQPDNVSTPLAMFNTSAYQRQPSATIATDTLFIAIVELRANGATLWVDNVEVFTGTDQSLSMPTLATSDTIDFGTASGVVMDCDMHGCALVPGALTSQDRTNLQTDWQAALAPAAAGPTITVQPANDTGFINGDPARRSTVYTLEATGEDIEGVAWYEGEGIIEDGGIYAIDTEIAEGGGSVVSTLTITRTAKAGTPFTITGEVTDANGVAYTDNVTDTWYTGPVLAESSGVTDSSGEHANQCTSDYVTAGTPDQVVVEATAGGVTKYVTLDFVEPA